jgi:curved DNA-binding protein
MAHTDYYKVLGVDKKASPDEIKKAFRRLAVRYHPDRNPSDTSAEETFKQINEAYAVLSDPQKKEQYDTCGSSGFHRQFSQEDIFRGFDFTNAYKDMGTAGGEDIFSRMFGGAFSRGGLRRSPQKGGDLELQTDISFRDAVHGAEKLVAFRRNGTREELKVRIPAGVDNGSRIRIAGKGGQGGDGSNPGDLYLVVRVLPDPTFTRDGGDLFVERAIPFSAASLGTSLEVPTLEGNKRIKVPPGIQAGTKIRLKGCGVKPLGSNVRGDLYVRIGVQVPVSLSEEQRRLVKELALHGL